MITDSKFINPKGTFLDAISQVDSVTIKHACDIQKSRLTNLDMRNENYWTGDFSLYTFENGGAVFYLSKAENNLVFKNPKNLFYSFTKKSNYFPKDYDISSIISSDSINSDITLKTQMSELNLFEFDNEWSYFEIFTASKKDDEKYNYDLLNPAQRSVAEWVHGSGEDFVKTMNMLNNAGITRTVISLLHPCYVRNVLRGFHANSIARISYINNFEGHCDFHANCKDVDFFSRNIIGLPYTK